MNDTADAFDQENPVGKVIDYAYYTRPMPVSTQVVLDVQDSDSEKFSEAGRGNDDPETDPPSPSLSFSAQGSLLNPPHEPQFAEEKDREQSASWHNQIPYELDTDAAGDHDSHTSGTSLADPQANKCSPIKIFCECIAALWLACHRPHSDREDARSAGSINNESASK